MNSLGITLLLMFGAVAVALPLGTVVAILLVRCGAAGRRAVTAILIGTLALPLYLHASGWEATAGKFGWVPLLQTTGSRYWFSGLTAAIWIHGVSGAAWVALLVAAALRRLPGRIDEAWRLDASPWRATCYGALPLVMPAIVLAGLWVALLAATEMTVADLYGTQTLPVRVYQQYALEGHATSVLLACLLPGAVAAAAALGLLWWQRPRRISRRGAAIGRQGRSRGEAGAAPTAGSPPARVAASIGLAAAVGLMLGVPIGSLVLKAGWTVDTIDGHLVRHWSAARFAATGGETLRTFGPEFQWTLLLASLAGASAILLGTPLARLAQRGGRGLGATVLVLSIAGVLLPGPVVALAVIRMFNIAPEVPGSSWLAALYDQTLIPTLLALWPRVVPAGTLVMWLAMRRLPPELDQAARLDGAGPWARWLRIELPQLRGALAVAGIAGAVLATADVSATMLVMPPGVSTVGTRIFGLLHSGVRYQEAGLALAIIVAVGTMVLIGWGAQRIWPAGSRVNR